ncbi:hypothetical protein BZG36_01005 [Bifiguratus adelaidae]|uniref:EF-hand domain-containing protein n=1 Tax=Bifiguratus adelaidae TaxID=1938954 RepID=A0A261Y6E4_9FUNG|nr:hypothetical protein BZG36_01005 [Bifiguratus adelaidae]
MTSYLFEDYRAAFKLFDQDGDGLITLFELRHVLATFQLYPMLSDANHLIAVMMGNEKATGMDFGTFIKLMAASEMEEADYFSCKSWSGVPAYGSSPSSTVPELECPSSTVSSSASSVTSTTSSQGTIEAELRAAFQLFDQDGDGLVSSKELTETLHLMGESVTRHQVQKMVNEVCPDSDKLGFHDFVRLMDAL